MRRTFAVVTGALVVLGAAGCVEPPPPPPPTPAVLAVAYSNLDGVHGYDPSGSDVLIAKLLDSNADGVVSAGDTVVADRYPLDLGASAFGAFQTTTAQVMSGNSSATQVYASTPTGAVVFSDAPGVAEFFEVQGPVSGNATFQDTFQTTTSDLLVVQANAPLVPDTPVALTVGSNDVADAPFVDVDILVP